MWQFSPDNLGAFAFGAIIGWYIYYVNRYRKGEVQFSDITTLVGAIGGAAVLKLFEGTTEAPGSLFGWYGIGLAVGFFGYFLTLVGLVNKSENFNADWFLDGRRKDPADGWSIPGDTRQTFAPMYPTPQERTTASAEQTQGPFKGSNPADPAGQVLMSPGPAYLPEVMAAASPKAGSVIRACKAEWPGTKGDCNQFVKAVGSHFGVTLTGNADAIVTGLSGPHWTRLANGQAAAQAAREGHFVVGGMTSGDLGSAHGHVVVVVDGPLAHGLYPSAYWGSLNPSIRDKGGLGETVNWSFSKSHRDRITYAARRI
jgi:hypothetical protein